MKNSCTVTFLSFVTDENRQIRETLFRSCFPSFESLKEKNSGLDVFAASVDNFSTEDVREEIKRSRLLDMTYLLDRNMFDIALFCAGIDAANFFNTEYVLFTYDDFFIYRPESLTDCIEFMNDSGVDCVRVTEYSVSNRSNFDSSVTSKSVNPDAVRHFNMATGEKIEHKSAGKYGNSDFFLTNWHYTSRPSLWRVSSIQKMLNGIHSFHVLQGFEGHMIKLCNESQIKFATLDSGMMRTFPVNLSARTSPGFVKTIDETSHRVESDTIWSEIKKCKTVKSERQ